MVCGPLKLFLRNKTSGALSIYFFLICESTVGFLVFICDRSFFVFSFKNLRFTLTKSYGMLDKTKCAPIRNFCISCWSNLSSLVAQLLAPAGWCCSVVVDFFSFPDSTIVVSPVGLVVASVCREDVGSRLTVGSGKCWCWR